MTRFLLRRAGHAVFLLFGVSVLAFVFSTLAPGNYFDEMRLNPQISADRVTALRAEYQVDRPMVARYAHWAGRCCVVIWDSRSRITRRWRHSLDARAQHAAADRHDNHLSVAAALPLGVWSAERLAGRRMRR